ncbi:preprotein translocase subunit YajC [Spirochaetia bacterium]|nr:preprotein translocase subunit YajC [Spirochaetia bacterium]
MRFFPSLLMAPPPDGTSGAAPGGVALFMQFFPIVLIIGVFYFLIIRPQNRKQKDTQKMLAALKKGDRVVTIGGIHGIISSVKENSVILKIDENAKIEFSRSAIATVTSVSEEGKIEDKTGENK